MTLRTLLGPSSVATALITLGCALAPAAPAVGAGATSPTPAVTQVDSSRAERGTCYRREEVITTSRGRFVWIPASLATQWFGRGATVEVSWSRSRDVASTKGSSDSVSGGGGVTIGIAEASAEYNREWNRSTTTSRSYGTSYAETWSFTQRARVRVYQPGREFKVSKTMYFTNCDPLRRSWLVRAPTRTGAQLVEMETWANRGKYKY